MKIGILTQPLHNNYGGLLQNYALQQTLKRMGHEVVTIDHGIMKVPFLRLILSRIKTSMLLPFAPQQNKTSRYRPNDEELAAIRKNTNHFIDKYISRTAPLCTTKEFDDIAKTNEYNAYVVGSDQCWRISYNGLFQKEMFLRFAVKQKDVKRIAYAASFGTDSWEMGKQTTKECARLAKMFDLVTVREVSGVSLCKEYLGVDAIPVIDPTMLLSKEDYEELVEDEQEPQSSGNLFYYILDPCETKKKIIDNIAREYGYVPFTVLPKCQAENRTEDDVKMRIEDCVYPSVTSWLRAFKDAKMIIVDSFHGAVFSIIFNKPFWVIANKRRGNTRFESLLGLFGLEDRMIKSDIDSIIDMKKCIDWEKVNAIRMSESIRCKKLLMDTLTK